MIRVTADNLIHSFTATHEPAVVVPDGATVLLTTADCYCGQVRDSDTKPSQVDRTRLNPATGPIYITGAAPGDTLAIDILELSPAGWGLTVAVPGMGLLGGQVATEQTRIVEINGEDIRLGRVRLPYHPMLGVIGVAPRVGAISTVTPGMHGGNLDCTLAATGATVLLPVSHPGALFAAGDMHAAMADGEVSGTGIETGGTALLKLTILRDVRISWPWITNPSLWAVLVSAPTVEEAAKEAMRQAISRLQAAQNLTFEDAYMIAGSAVALRICQVVNPLVTVRAEIPASLLNR